MAGPSFQSLILKLQSFWADKGCLILQPYDMEVGAGTSHPATVLRALGPNPWKAAYVQPSRRPKDGRYGENPNRLQHYYQYQVVWKPSPIESQELYLDSLRHLGIDTHAHDIRFVEDDWENPTLGAWGLGWEVWCDGMEVTQFTYFQQVGGIECDPVTVELTYGLERLAMYIQGVENVYDLAFNEPSGKDGALWRRLSRSRTRIFGAQFRSGRHRDAAAPLHRRGDRVQGAARRATCRCPPMINASRPAIASTCSMRAAPSRWPSARPISAACAPWPRPAAKSWLAKLGAD